MHNRIYEERGELNFSEKFQKSKQDKIQWLIDHQEELLDTQYKYPDSLYLQE
ncbi:hypothetical protein [Acinetobacter guerrae]|uniref:hypothetical protein n=1 Tax=Acinetobacter guerrae TaxID=1843371 RepID=UPI00148F27DC|nr:hypothetical protein [Acinetobacter guerrae]